MGAPSVWITASAPSTAAGDGGAIESVAGDLVSLASSMAMPPRRVRAPAHVAAGESASHRLEADALAGTDHEHGRHRPRGYSAPSACLDLLGAGGEHLGLFHLGGMRAERHAFPARQDVEMQMEHHLTAGRLVGLVSVMPSALNAFITALATFCTVLMQAASCAWLASSILRTDALGITSVWPWHLGMMSMKARVSASS